MLAALGQTLGVTGDRDEGNPSWYWAIGSERFCVIMERRMNAYDKSYIGVKIWHSAAHLGLSSFYSSQMTDRHDFFTGGCMRMMCTSRTEQPARLSMLSSVNIC